jgi:hypothetical protein
MHLKMSHPKQCEISITNSTYHLKFVAVAKKIFFRNVTYTYKFRCPRDARLRSNVFVAEK